MERKEFLRLSLLAPLGTIVPPFNLQFSDSACQKPDFVKPGNPEYDVLRRGFNLRINRHPALIASCQTTADVAEAILYASKNRLPVAVKSGGHCMEGYSVNNKGMTINMSSMNKVEWIDQNTIRVGPGCTLAQLYSELLPKNRIIPGGSCAGVGIGGLALGGGYGLLSRSFGLTCDSLLGLTMVDGSGKIVKASGNDELMWACRGGNSGNFGVVTEMVFKTHAAPATMRSYRFRAFRVNTVRAEQILREWFRLSPKLPPECFSAFVLNRQTVYMLLTNTGKETNALKEIIASLTKLTDKTTSSEALPLQRALQNYYGITKPIYFKNASAGLYKSYAEIESCIKSVMDKVISTPGIIYQINTLGGNIRNPDAAKASAFPHRDYLYFSELQTYWEQPSQEKRLLDSFEQVQVIFRQQGLTAQYRNYPDARLPGWETAYYGDHYTKLQRIKKQYDPNNIFQYEQSIRPA